MTPAPALTASQVQRRTTTGRVLLAHPWIGHVLLVAVVLLVGAFTALLASETVRGATALGLFEPGSPVHDRVVRTWLAGAGLGAVVLLARRRWPLAVTGVLTALAVASLAVGGVLGVLGLCLAWSLHAVAARRSARTAWVAGSAVLAVVTVAVWWWQDVGLAEVLLWSDEVPLGDGPPAWQVAEPGFSAGRRSWTVLLLLALLVLGAVTGAGAQARRLHARDLAERYAALARERDASAALARSAERARIAREVHDIVAHSVSVMVALSDGAASALDRAPEASRQALAELSRTGRAALGDMRSVLGSLGPDGAPDDDRPALTAPTETDLHAVVERFRAAGLPLTTTGLDADLPADTALRLAVVRVVTEALTNVLRHAPGTPSTAVTLRRTGTAVEVEVVDAGGTGPGETGGSRRGLVGMRERAALLGGHVEAGPAPGGGWRVRVVLPAGAPGEGGCGA
ncbi:sensor histidine kinase [Kineococcus rhizosphaerae]|uniref:histidine kinase n=1 Tax=Kineococcus rhizosphaerae TaxID=559628 RepID=A0A2T0R0A1_9ACTN|nr:histidine kinase [Kineococcus rhizosphaerae]PRY12547.1 histidine kinase [Kineococcus rhizosphaerae]